MCCDLDVAAIGRMASRHVVLEPEGEVGVGPARLLLLSRHATARHRSPVAALLDKIGQPDGHANADECPDGTAGCADESSGEPGHVGEGSHSEPEGYPRSPARRPID